MSVPVFPKGARVVFAGDSLTNGNRYLCHIVEYYKNHLSDRNVKFYNCGISGGTISTLLAVFDTDIMYYEPTHIMLTIGGNDSGIIYMREKDETTYDKLSECFESFKKNLLAFEALCKERGITLCLGTPQPYAEYQPVGTTLYHGGYALWKHYADYMIGFAKERGYGYCDYHSYLTREMMFKELYRVDHVHPNDLGHYYIAKCFLEGQGFTLESDELSPEILEWNARTLAVRDVFVAMYEITGFSVSVSEAKEMIEAFMKENDAKEKPNVYRRNLSNNFLRSCDKFDENREWLKSFRG